MSNPRFQLSRGHKIVRRSSGNITINGTTWANLDTGLDITLAAQIGDDIQVGINGRWENGGTGTNALLDVATLVSGSVVNYFGGAVETNTGEGIPGWSSGEQGGVNYNTDIGAPRHRTLVSGDISSNTVTLRLRCKTAAAQNRVLRADSGLPLEFWARNIGPADPN